MMTAKAKRKIRADSKQHSQHPQQSQSAINSKNILKRLSFSFYGQDTIKKSKQIIFDNCDLIQDLPVLTQSHKDRQLRSYRNSNAPSRASKSKKKNSVLDIENYFYQKKCDQIDLVPTNASHNDTRSRQHSLTKIKMPARPTTSKNKKNTNTNIKIEFERRNCQTAMGRKGELKSHRRCSKKKQSGK